jgi:hypothetical protein
MRRILDWLISVLDVALIIGSCALIIFIVCFFILKGES